MTAIIPPPAKPKSDMHPDDVKFSSLTDEQIDLWTKPQKAILVPEPKRESHLLR